MHPSTTIDLRKLLFIATLLVLLALSLTRAVSAEELLPAYPPLPTGYSSIKIFDNQGRFVGRLLPDKRYWVSIDRIPVFLQNALVAVEDSRFYEHSGIDIRGIARALVKDVVKGRLAEGGSTITQQLIKNKYLSNEKTIDRKLREGMMAIDFEKKYTKRQILEMYFNEIYYGHGAWGIAQAARIYFDKSPEELTEGECAILAGVPKNPGRYNPLGDPARITARRDIVLKRMVALKMIAASQRKKLRGERIAYTPANQAPYYLAQIRNRLVEQFGPQIIDQGGLEISAALDLNLQKLAEQTLRDGVKRLSPQLQGAMICLDPVTGDLLAAVGGVDFAQSSYDRAFQARRQPGSAIKPLIYAAALDKGYTAASIWNDTPVSYGSWQPQNYGGERLGELSLRQALAHSNNVIAVKLLEAVGVPAFVDYAARLGLPLRSPNDLSLALGTDEVSLKELVLAYAPLATGGNRPEARTIIRMYDTARRSWSDTPPAVTPVLSPATAFVTTSMLKDVLTYGTAKGLAKFAKERPAAGKTGTTDDYRDAWFIGYTPQLVTGVWVGYDKPRPGGRGFTGGGVAAPIWERFMRPALASRPVSDFPQPETVIAAAIDPTNGQLATPTCPQQRTEFFIIGSEPTEYCPEHGAPPPTEPTTEPLLQELTTPPDDIQGASHENTR